MFRGNGNSNGKVQQKEKVGGDNIRINRKDHVIVTKLRIGYSHFKRCQCQEKRRRRELVKRKEARTG